MGLFEKQRQERADKDRSKADAKLRELGLLLDEVEDSTIHDKNVESLRRISGGLVWLSSGSPFANSADTQQIALLKVLAEQNFIVIRQNEQIIRLLARGKSLVD